MGNQPGRHHGRLKKKKKAEMVNYQECPRNREEFGFGWRVRLHFPYKGVMRRALKDDWRSIQGHQVC